LVGREARELAGFAEEVGELTVTGLFLSNKNTIEPAIVLLALVLREASSDS